MKHLEMVNGVTIEQAAKLIGLTPAKVLKLATEGLLEPISFGAVIEGITFESTTIYLKLQLEKKIFLRNSIEKAHKSWDCFEKGFIIIDDCQSIKFNSLYAVYSDWTRREGLLTLTKCELADFLIEIKNYSETWINNHRVIGGIAFQKNLQTENTDISYKLLENILKTFSTKQTDVISGTFQEIADLLKVESARIFRKSILNAAWLLKDNNINFEINNKRTAKSRASITIKKL